MTESDRREMERFSLVLPALLSMADESLKQKPFEVMTQNISSGGAFFITDAPISMGAQVKMDLILPLKKDDKSKETKTHIDVSGFVIRTEEHGLAVCFNKKFNISPFRG